MDTEASENLINFKKVYHFLMAYFPIWEKEVLNYYPDSYDHFPRAWVDQLLNLSETEKWHLDSKQSFDSVSETDLGELFVNIKNLGSLIERVKIDETKLSIKEATGLKIKKQHEIEKLNAFLEKQKKLSSNQFPTSFFDIGGGKGHLSRLLSQKLNMSGSCIEMNSDFISKGEKLLKGQKVRFVHAKLPENNSEESKNILKENKIEKNELCIGLHTCGPLANSILKACVENHQEHILNFGCCYLKLTPGSEIGISAVSKKYPLPLSKYALTLATRAHTGLSWDDYLMKRKVKSYRYGIHLFLYYQLNLKTFINVGDGKKLDYEKPFSTYVLKKLKHLNIKSNLTEKEIDRWFKSSTVQLKISEMFCMNIIRWQFGRLIELWILLDRALYLEESNFKVKVGEYFDEKISPRNIGIYAQKVSE